MKYFRIFVKYAVKFDAGACGTKMHIYEWNSEFTPNKTHPLEIREIASCVTDGKKLILVNYLKKWYRISSIFFL